MARVRDVEGKSAIEDNLREAVRKHANDLELSRLSGLDQPRVTRFKNAKRGLSAGGIERLADALGFDLVLVKRK